eukprot:209987_1
MKMKYQSLQISIYQLNPSIQIKKCSTTCTLSSISENNQSDHSDDDNIYIIDTSSYISFTQSPRHIINILISFFQVNTIILCAYNYYSYNLNTFTKPISFY